MLVPVQKVGGIIGCKGEFIKKIIEETKAQVKILDGPPGTSERAPFCKVMVSAKEELNLSHSPAMDALLRVHKRIIDVDTNSTHATSSAVGTIITRVADTQAGSLIGKRGSTIKSIQDASNCTIRVLNAEHLPKFVLKDDSIVEVHGEPAGVHKAVELILNHLQKFLVDRSIVGVFETCKCQKFKQTRTFPHTGPGALLKVFQLMLVPDLILHLILNMCSLHINMTIIRMLHLWIISIGRVLCMEGMLLWGFIYPVSSRNS